MPFPFQVQRLARALQKRLGIQGYIPLTLVEDVLPIIELSHYGPETDFLLGVHRFSRRIVQGPVVAQFSSVRLENPAAGRTLVHVERAIIPSLGAGIPFRWGTALITATGGGTAIAHDGRRTIAGNSATAANITGIPAAASGLAGDPAGLATLAAAETLILDHLAWVLPPGGSLIFECTVVNTAIDVSLTWTETELAPQEAFGG